MPSLADDVEPGQHGRAAAEQNERERADELSGELTAPLAASRGFAESA